MKSVECSKNCETDSPNTKCIFFNNKRKKEKKAFQCRADTSNSSYSDELTTCADDKDYCKVIQLIKKNLPELNDLYSFRFRAII